MGMRRQARETISCREFQVSPSCWVLIHLLPALMELPSSLWISIYALCIFHPLLKATVCVSLVDLSSLNESSCEFSWSFIGGGRTGGWWSRNQGSNASAREWEGGAKVGKSWQQGLPEGEHACSLLNSQVLLPRWLASLQSTAAFLGSSGGFCGGSVDWFLGCSAVFFFFELI